MKHWHKVGEAAAEAEQKEKEEQAAEKIQSVVRSHRARVRNYVDPEVKNWHKEGEAAAGAYSVKSHAGQRRLDLKHI